MNVTDELVREYFQHCYADDLASERFRSMGPDEQRELIDRSMDWCRRAMERFVEVFNNRTPDRLTGYLHPSNKFFRRLFERWTGLKLPAGSRATINAVREFIGPAEYDNYLARLDAERAREKAEREAAREAAEREDQLADTIRHGGELMTMREFIDRAIASGYEPIDAKRGFATVTHLVRGETGYELRKKYHRAYAHERFAETRTTSNERFAASPAAT